MIDTRFIFVEGIMGAGKSTAVQFLTEQLQRNGIAAQFPGGGADDRQARASPACRDQLATP